MPDTIKLTKPRLRIRAAAEKAGWSIETEQYTYNPGGNDVFRKGNMKVHVDFTKAGAIKIAFLVGPNPQDLHVDILADTTRSQTIILWLGHHGQD